MASRMYLYAPHVDADTSGSMLLRDVKPGFQTLFGVVKRHNKDGTTTCLLKGNVVSIHRSDSEVTTAVRFVKPRPYFARVTGFNKFDVGENYAAAIDKVLEEARYVYEDVELFDSKGTMVYVALGVTRKQKLQQKAEARQRAVTPAPTITPSPYITVWQTLVDRARTA